MRKSINKKRHETIEDSRTDTHTRTYKRIFLFFSLDFVPEKSVLGSSMMIVRFHHENEPFTTLGLFI